MCGPENGLGNLSLRNGGGFATLFAVRHISRAVQVR